jgi:GT2 family glycosyltransferase
MTRVCALVVTRDRPQLLVECLLALQAQTVALQSVIVFDNASSDDTQARLREARVDASRLHYARSRVNLGGAGGFAEALRLGQASDAEWLWLMDDDAEPRRDALERLLDSPAAQTAGTAAVCSAVVHRDGTIDPLHRCRLGRLVTPLPASAYAAGISADVDCASFVGLLIRRDAARAAGLPRSEFFLGYDDAEYSLRLRRHGAIRLVPESVVVHKIPIGGGSVTRRSRLANRLLRASYTSSPWETYWKDLYRLRNLLVLMKDHRGLSPWALAWLIAVYALKTLLYDPVPVRRMPWLVRFALRGYRGDFTAPTPEGWATMVRERRARRGTLGRAPRLRARRR